MIAEQMGDGDPATRAAYARSIFVHYFRMAVEGSGWKWSADCEAEINAAIDDLLEAAVQS